MNTKRSGRLDFNQTEKCTLCNTSSKLHGGLTRWTHPVTIPGNFLFSVSWNISRCPYIRGVKFRLLVSAPSGTSYEAGVTVLKAFTPFTISPAMKVLLDPVNYHTCSYLVQPASVMVLKVYNPDSLQASESTIKENYSPMKPKPAVSNRLCLAKFQKA